MTQRLICFGEMLVRLTAPAGEMLLQTPRLSAHIGGAEANVAICVSRLGGAAAMASVLPDNALGRAARDELRRHGVDVSRLAFTAGRMGLYFLTPGAVTRPAEIVYDRAGSAFALAAPSAIDWPAALKGAEWLHVSGINPAVSESAGKAALAAMEAASAAGLSISYDGNYRSSLWKARGETGADILRRMLAHARLAFIDERDIALVLGTSFAGDADQRRRLAIEAAFDAFPKLERIAHTSRDARGVDDHALGAALHTRGSLTLSLEPIALPGIVDRIGGGDAFAGGLLYALMAGTSDADALAFALHSAAWKHGQSGDSSHASAEDIRGLMSAGGFDVKR
jgi:2-dehydro-3-deoxygluconokinase